MESNGKMQISRGFPVQYWFHKGCIDVDSDSLGIFLFLFHRGFFVSVIKTNKIHLSLC